MSEKIYLKLKIVILGDSSTNKTEFLSTFSGNQEQSLTTLGLDVMNKYIQIDDMLITLVIYDTVERENFKNYVPETLKGAHGAIYLYDITNKSSFEKLKQKYINNIEGKYRDVKFIITGNKIDLNEHREVSKEEVLKFCEEKNLEHIEISSKSNDNVNACFKMLINSIVKDKSKEDLIKLYGNKDNYNICKEEENKLEKK